MSHRFLQIIITLTNHDLNVKLNMIYIKIALKYKKNKAKTKIWTFEVLGLFET